MATGADEADGPAAARATTEAAGHAATVLAIMISLAVGAGLIAFGPDVAEALIAALAPDGDGPVLDSLFNGVIFGGMLVAALALGLAYRVAPLAPGRRIGAMIALGLFVGLFGVAVAAGYAGIVGTLHPQGMGPGGAGLLLWGAAIVLLQAGAEEAFFRGWLQPVLARRWGIAPAIVAAALAFAALHVMGGARAPVTLVNLFLGGMLFGLLAAYGRGIAGAVAAHFAWNATEQLMLGLDPNPGVGSFGTLLDFDLIGNAAWGGSDEGLNASLAMSVALAALLVPLVLLLRRRISD